MPYQMILEGVPKSISPHVRFKEVIYFWPKIMIWAACDKFCNYL